jgi:hypothetical protein
MPEMASLFEEAGHKITHKWWEAEDTPENDRTVNVLAEQAGLDMYGVRNCDALVLFSTGKSEGKAVEQGLALAWEKPIVAIGKRGEFSSNVFHYLGNYRWVETFDGALDQLYEISKER